MTFDQERVQELFNAASELPSAEGEPFLDRECGDDDDLRAEVKSLLKHHFSSAKTVRPSEQSTKATLDYKPGDKIGAFKILNVLGEGGQGIVYLAEQSKPVKRRVALKVIKAGMDTKRVIARFEAERQALAILNHPGIAQVYEAGATEHGRPYFVMEYVKGMSITEGCDEHKLNITQRLELIAKVCDAVQHSHSKLIIHRDLKPSNILVSLEDGTLEPKIIDFGVAKAMTYQLTEKTLVTQVGHFVGTPAYMSPEQADLKSIDIDTKTDVYALGVILYEVLTGMPPFKPEALRDAGLEKMREIIRTQPPPKPSTKLSSMDDSDDATKIAEVRQTQIAALAGLLRKELEWIPLKALRKQRSERYNSAKSMGDDIRRYLGGEPLEAGPESAAYRFKKTLRKHTAAALAIAAVFVALVATVISISTYAVKTEGDEVDFSIPVVDVNPCGEIPIDKEYRVVLLIDGSGSMSMKDGYNKLWDPTLIAVRKQIQAFPEGTELQIIVFNTVGTRAHWQKHSTGKLTDQSRGNALRFVQRLSDPKGGTPFYYSLDKVIESQSQWLKEGPTFRTADVIIYVDGDDLSAEGSGADGFNKDGKVSRRDKITIDTINKKMDSLGKDKTNLGLNIDISLVRLSPKVKANLVGIPIYELGKGGIVPIPHPVSVTSPSSTLPEVVSGETAITLDVDIMCPEYIESSNSKMQIRAVSKSRGVAITSKTRSIDIKKDVNRQKVTLQIQGTAADIAKGFRGELIFEYPKNRSHPIQGTTNIDFTVAAKKQPPVVSKSKIQVHPPVVMVGDQVRLDYLSPIANSTPSWSREDGEPITNSNKWNNANTRFSKKGNYVVNFAVTRGGLSSERISVTVPVKDVTLLLEQVTKNPIAGSDVEFMVSYTGLKPADYEWRVDGDIVRGEVEHVLTHRFEQHGKRTVEVRGTIKLGDRELTTKWYSTTVDIAERKAIHLNVPAEHCWAFLLKVKVFVDGNIQKVTFELIDPNGRRVGKQQTKSVQETMQPSRHLDKTASAQFELPEKDGVYTVRVSDSTGNIIVEKDVVLRGPQFRVTLDDPQLTGQNIFVGEEEQFQLTIHGREAVAVNKVSWSLFNQSGEDQPAPVTSRNDQFRVSFDVFLPNDGLIANGETSTSTLKFFTARGTELMVPGLGQWHITARQGEQEYKIQDGKDPQVDWEDSIRIFELTPFNKNIDNIQWSVLKDGVETFHEALGPIFEYDFKRNGLGDCEIRAIVNLEDKTVHLWLHRTLSSPSCVHVIQDNKEPQVNWGETRVFEVTGCADYIAKIEWTVLKDGREVHSETVKQLEYQFKEEIGLYNIVADISYSIQDAKPRKQELSRTVSIVTGTSAVDFKKRTLRGDGIFEGEVTTTGSVLSAEVILKYADVTITIPVPLQPSSEDQFVTFSTKKFVGEPVGEISTKLFVTRPGGAVDPSEWTTLDHQRQATEQIDDEENE